MIRPIATESCNQVDDVGTPIFTLLREPLLKLMRNLRCDPLIQPLDQI
jgi:hypothetical protein